MNPILFFKIYQKKENKRKLFFSFIFFFILNFTSALYAQQTGCPNDFDCDGIIDAFDVDDDNDGIYDHIESPGCFYLDKKAYETGDRREQLEFSTTLPYTSGKPEDLLDGITNTGGIAIPSKTPIVNHEVFRLTTRFAAGIEYSSIVLSSSYYLFASTTEMVLQGSKDGLNWINLTATLKPGSVITLTLTVDPDKRDLYKHYRLWGITGTTYAYNQSFREIAGIVGNYMPSLYPKATCEGEDIDGDGMPNHQDLDADGDGTSDVLEAGFSDPDKDGKLGNHPITVDQYGAVNSAFGYTTPYEYYKIPTINAIKDTDNDGVSDVLDIDDDNDGIYDHIESPNCFELDKKAYETGDRRAQLGVSTTLSYTEGALEQLVDGVTATGGIAIPASTPITNHEIFRLTTKLASGIEYSSIVLSSSYYLFTSTTEMVLQGSKDGKNWTSLTSNLKPGSPATLTIKIDLDKQDLYRHYRLWGIAGTTNGYNQTFREITGIVGHYIPSLYLKATCDGEDIDGDGKPNHQDLDADGDGISDVIEAGFSDPDKDGKLGNQPITVDQHGAVISANGYSIPYEYYKIAAIDATKDTDKDGVWDVLDVDDDNDGIYDHIESPACFELDKKAYETGDRRAQLGVSTTLPYTNGTLEQLVDGATATGGITIPASSPIENREIFRLTTKLAMGIEYSSITLSSTNYVISNTAEIVLQGSKDGENWITLTANLKPGLVLPLTIKIDTDKQDLYRHYRLWGITGTTHYSVQNLTEVTGTVENYMPSLYLKATCDGEDIDGDGKPNHQDLDADGDGISDVIEAGFSDPDKDGKLGDQPITVDPFGAVTSAFGYTIPYEYYKIAAIDATKDTDDDGVWDVLDVDDDNDGIYDHIESPNCFELDKKIYETGDRRAQLGVSTTLSYTEGALEQLVDGVTATGGIAIPASTPITNHEIFRLTTKLALGIEYSSIVLSSSTYLFNTNAEMVLQGSKDGKSWTPLTSNLKPGSPATLTIKIDLDKQDLYRHYRLWGIAGTTNGYNQTFREITGVVGNYIPSLYQKATCEGEDIDGDSKPNHQDLDADGDGVSDVLEAGFSDPDNDGKLGDQPIIVDQYGAVTSALGYSIPYEYYKIAAIDATKDTDNDGVWDVLDVDDDNDGIYDYIESPACFELEKKVYETGDRRAQLGVSTTLPHYGGEMLQQLVDGVTTTGGITIPISTPITNQEVFRLTTKLAMGIEYSSIVLTATTSIFSSTAEMVLQGSNDGKNWTVLTANFKPGTSTTLTFKVDPDKQNLYRHYRLWGIAGTTYTSVQNLREITGVVDHYIPSLYQKTQCEGEDLDGDGIPNHQDLDADGDGAFDVLEGGFSDPDKDGKLGDQPITVDQYGAVNSALGYSIPYEYYKIPAIDATKDSDKDGISNVFDLDDDNDGIYDHIESPNCFELDKKVYETGDRREKLGVSTTLPYTDGALEQLVDGITTTSGITIPISTPIANQEIFRLTTKLAMGIKYSSIVLTTSNYFAYNTTEVVLQGSKDGKNWINLTTTLKPGAVYTITINIDADKQDLYRHYRLWGITGTSYPSSQIFREITGITNHYLPSLYPKAKCEGEDLDEDGIPNHQDLDTDGDGASDVLEAGFSDPDGDGRLGTNPVSVNPYGAIRNHGYVSPFAYYKMKDINLTKDTDSDGVWDVFDVDDDNDGIYDHIESLECFDSKNAYETGDRREQLEVSTTLSYTGLALQELVDGITNVGGIRIPVSESIQNHEVFRLTTKLAMGIEYTSIVLTVDYAIFSTGSKGILQGSNDGLSWTDLTEDSQLSTTNPITISVTKNQGLYRVYRLLGTTGTTYSARIIREITGIVDNYMPSLYPKTNCQGGDIDGDGVPNHQDLNADGDTCYDVIEAGFIDDDKDGILGNSPVTVNESGMVTSAQGYVTPNNMYWLDITKNVCTGEGIPEDEDSHCSDLEDLNSDANLAQSIFHSTIVSTKDGFSIFGQATRPTGSGNLETPTPMTPENGFTYEGEIRLATLAGVSGGGDDSQYFILSTKGLYVWGPYLSMTIPPGWTSKRTFSEIPLPAGIAPENIKSMSASYTNLVLLTKSGDVYITTGSNPSCNAASYGDGSTIIDKEWHKASISQVVSIKINSAAQAFAMTHSGKLYTWGPLVYLGDGIPPKTQYLPTKMTLPAAITKVKMTALTNAAGATYFVLGEDKRVYSLGGGGSGILGINSTSASNIWQTVKSPSGIGAGTGTGYLENIKFITATLHDNTTGAAGAIDENGVPYLWGENGASRLGAPGGANVPLPRVPNGITPGFHNVIAVEMGGHVTPIIDKRLGKFGYIGHKTSGSMGIPGEGTLTTYDFENTPEVDFCNIVIGARKKMRVTVNPMNINTTVKKE